MKPVRVAKWLMKLSERHPVPPDREIGDLGEIFQHPVFVNGTPHERREILWKSSLVKFGAETTTPWDPFFGRPLAPFLKGKTVLDLGCATGGRSVAWLERYQCARLIGIDITPHYIDAARQFADARGAAARFAVAQSEALPFRSGSFDAILSCDVFEHVQSVESTLRECHRVLREGGRLFVAFPSFYHPLDHHLNLVTNFPAIHYFFAPRVLVRAYAEIIDERGEAAKWYRRSPTLEPWERGNTINGVTARRLRRMLSRMDWVVLHRGRVPIGRTISRRRFFRPFDLALHALAAVPVLDDFVVNRIAYILEK